MENLRRDFPNLRIGWEKTEKLHLTLKFLGDIDEIQLQHLNQAVEKSARQVANFSLEISGTGVFSSKRNAKILWLGLKDEKGSLQNLNDILENECEQIGFAKEKRNFKAHLTIARLREPHKSKDLVERHLENDFKAIEFAVSEIVIYQSLLQKSGSIYQTVSSSKLKGSS